ncbi:MAG: hypothetical protein KF752_05325 [Pirellulaceae bacterium]|nr:hypothetical protein [Pirellulaceae bacterium]
MLDALRLRCDDTDIFYCRDRLDVVECSINPDKFDAKAVEVFRNLCPKGDSYIVSPAVKQPYRLRNHDFLFIACAVRDLPSV